MAAACVLFVLLLVSGPGTALGARRTSAPAATAARHSDRRGTKKRRVRRRRRDHRKTAHRKKHKTAARDAGTPGKITDGLDAKGAKISDGDPLTAIGVAPTTTSASNPSGVPMPTGDLPGWKQVFADDFSQAVPVGGFSGCASRETLSSSSCSGLPAAVRSQLWAYPDWWSDTSGNGRYMPSKVLSIHDNMLDYNLHTSGGTHMVAAVVPKIPGGPDGTGLQYGAYAVRFKADPIPGYKTAFLLWPDSGNWPADGEIDFPEGNLDGTMNAYMHRLGATSGGEQDAFPTSETYASWHTAVIEWTPHLCRFILDGRVIGSSYSLIPNTPMHWVLQAETALSGGAPADGVAGHIYIAWIAAYAQTE